MRFTAALNDASKDVRQYFAVPYLSAIVSISSNISNNTQADFDNVFL